MTHLNTLDTQLDAYGQRAARRGAKKSAAEILGYTAAAGGLAFAGGDAIGGIVPFASTPVSASVGVNGNLNLGIDVDGVGGDDLRFFLGNIRTGTNTVFLNSFAGFAAVADGTAASASALNLTPGFTVGPTPVAGAFAADPFLLYSSGGAHSFGNFYNGTTGYIGFRFNGDTGSGGTQYGWMKVRIDTGDDFTKLRLLAGAYDDAGDPIAVGATDDGGGGEVPVPATPLLVLLGLGALGVQQFRRRRDAGLARLAEAQAQAAA